MTNSLRQPWISTGFPAARRWSTRWSDCSTWSGWRTTCTGACRRPCRRSGSSVARWPRRRWSPPAGRCPASAGCIRCIPTSCAPAVRGTRSSTRWTGFGTGCRSPPAGWWRFRTANRSSPCRRHSRSTSRASITPIRCRSSRRRNRCRPMRSGSRRSRTGSRYGGRSRVRSTCGMSTTRHGSPRLIGPQAEAHNKVWFRTDGKLPDDDLLHVCILAYLSDLTLLYSVLATHALSMEFDRIQMASLDHAMWFHRPFRADEWVLYDTSSPSASGARGLGTGHFFAQDGRMIATDGAGGARAAAMSSRSDPAGTAGRQQPAACARPEGVGGGGARAAGRPADGAAAQGWHPREAFHRRGSAVSGLPDGGAQSCRVDPPRACRTAGAGPPGRHR